jgi:zinc D-Ala-D-Ala carboxypeptidase
MPSILQHLQTSGTARKLFRFPTVFENMHSDEQAYRQRIDDELARLGISQELIAQKKLPFYREAQELTAAETDPDGRQFMMTPATANAWSAMKAAAMQDGVILEVVSAFRSIERQIDIIRNKLDRKMPMETILTLSAPPGYSEHHTGCAIDINTPGCVATEEEFESTDAFRWLNANAGRFGFTLSYPRNNNLGFIYEPWHWCFNPDAAQNP